ncbi:PIG-L deacetylase family protein [Streptomyces paromomycinus]|uniref:GlcNAc-PI de-N-acetylase n=1 Tax=Streptomyces paromomycinus TaxID=92743 RepID=A0A401VXE7_STREY|nr:PIG-L deacetylase family protein [Streptomyces paromomycinus]GCD41748.1 GlcNAc-PI de-N-acetylase [Streptomyces paromomycinus]
MSTLIFAPHPDDEVLGCGGSIARHTEDGRRAQIVYLTSGEQGVPGAGQQEAVVLREGEARQAAGVLGVREQDLHFLHLPDGGLAPADAGQFRAVLALVRRVRPTVVFLPHPGDGSFDHRQAFLLVWRALEMSGSRNYADCGEAHWVPTVLGYEVWEPVALPALLVDLGPAAERKKRALACYGSQHKGPGQAEHTSSGALAMARWRGAATTGGYREAFAVLRLDARAVAW